VPNQQSSQNVSIFKPVVVASLNAVLPVFSGDYVDEFGQPFTIQMRGPFSTERRLVPNVTVTFRPGRATFYGGNNIADFDEASGMFLYGIYMFDSKIRFTIQGRNEAEREWLLDTMSTAFTGLAFTQPSTGVIAINNLVSYLGSQGIIVKGWDDPEYSDPVYSDIASPRPEGQIYEATLPIIVDVSLTYLLPGVSAATVTMGSTFQPQDNPPLPAFLPLGPNPGTSNPLSL
jgi:hypothetical protein